MVEYILESLERQSTALASVLCLMKEEYELLKQGGAESLAQGSFTMYDLIQSVEQDRFAMQEKLLMPLGEYCKTLSVEDSKIIHDCISIIKSQEEMCKEQTEYNKALALGMVEQCRNNISFIQKNMGAYVEGTEYVSSGVLKINSLVQGNFLEGTL